MNTHRCTPRQCMDSLARRTVAQIAIPALILAVVGSATALAGGKHPAGHHHEDAHWAAPADAAKRANPVAVSDQSISNGKQIYQTHCASCHGATGEGDGPAGQALRPPAANLKVMAPQHSDGDLAWKIAEGRGAMPPWKGTLSENDIWDVVNHIKQMGGTEKAQRHGHDDDRPDDKHMHDAKHGHK